MSGRIKALEAELYTKNVNQQSIFSVEAGRDVQTDLTDWQKQALGQEMAFAQKQNRKRRHPTRTLSTYTQQLFNGGNPRFKWEDAIEREQNRVQIPEVYQRAQDEMIVGQLGLVETAYKNFQKSRARFDLVNPVGV